MWYLSILWNIELTNCQSQVIETNNNNSMIINIMIVGDHSKCLEDTSGSSY